MTGDPAMTSFTALRVHAPEKNRTEARFDQLSVDDLSTGEVVVRIAWTGINYKDALAVTGKGRILKSYPTVPGIDFAGHVESSSDKRYRPGAPRLFTGGNFGYVLETGRGSGRE